MRKKILSFSIIAIFLLTTLTGVIPYETKAITNDITHSEHSKHFENNGYLTLSLIFSNDDKMSVGHGNCSLKEDKIVTDIIEKPGPDKKIGDYYSMPTYVFSTEFMDSIKKVNVSERGELEIQDAIKSSIVEGKKVIGVNILPESKDFMFSDVS